MSQPLYSTASKYSGQPVGTFIRLLGWDGVAFVLNILLLSFNLRLHFQHRESPNAYHPVHAESLYLLSPTEVENLQTPPAASITTITPPPATQAVSISPEKSLATPLAAPTKPSAIVLTNTPEISPALHAQTTLLPAVKIPPRGTEPPAASPPKTVLSNTVAVTTPAKSAHTSTSCLAFGPLTHNRLQQLQNQWKTSDHPNEILTVLHTQPLHHYSVIFPPLGGNALTQKQSALQEEGFKQFEMWSEGKGHGVIIAGSFETENEANTLNQHLHDKGFKESYLMVRTSPTLYWLKHSTTIKTWLTTPHTPRAQGVAWKNIPCEPIDQGASTNLNPNPSSHP
jgi:hypothetical protein